MQHYPGKNSLNLVPKTLKICGVHIGRNIKGMTKGWLPAAFTLGNAQKGRRGGYGRPFPDGFGDGFLSIDRIIFVRCCLQIMLNCWGQNVAELDGWIVESLGSNDDWMNPVEALLDFMLLGNVAETSLMVKFGGFIKIRFQVGCVIYVILVYPYAIIYYVIMCI